MAHYWKRDSEQGFIEDTAYIKYEKFNNLRHSVIGFMMGDFDQEGNYVVAPQIKRELIEMPKFLVESMDNIEICRSEIKLNKHISFMVTFEGNKATLSLLEKINYEANFKLNSGAYSNVNEYVLDEVETSGVINRNVIYDRWNIKVIGTHEIDIFNCDPEVLEKYFGIVRRFKYLMVANTKLLKKEKEIEEVESAYSNKVLNILKAYPALNNEVLAEIKQSFIEKKKFVCADQPNFAKTLNEIIDTAITQNLDVLEEEQQLAFKAEHRNLIVETNIKREEILDIQEKAQVLTKEDVKYNKKNGKENENESTLVEIIVSDNELDQSVNAIAADFAKTQREVIDTIKAEVVADKVEQLTAGKNAKTTERKDLIGNVENIVGKEGQIISSATMDEITAKTTTNKEAEDKVTINPEKKQDKNTNKTKESVDSKNASNSWAENKKVPEYKYNAPKESSKSGAKSESYGDLSDYEVPLARADSSQSLLSKTTDIKLAQEIPVTNPLDVSMHKAAIPEAGASSEGHRKRRVPREGGVKVSLGGVDVAPKTSVDSDSRILGE